ncbi:MAG: hypothetical protein [Siphoviridae sp. ctdEk19]|nr:MAG: hypothetical protein [Siphoviridae sp. ctdEk19]
MCRPVRRVGLRQVVMGRRDASWLPLRVKQA